MKILATESLIIPVADYSPKKLIKRDSTKGIIVGTVQFNPGTVQFLVFLGVSVLLTEFLDRSWSRLY